ncbi:MAG: divalent heavy-metal cations transporter [Actinobacteria bacterium]|nr:divalent heavy-metal cations transporter [Actinomycetota bacterium]
MNISLALAAITALATTSGGLLAIKSRDRLHIVLGLAAGLLLGLVAFDLLPEVFDLNTNELNHVPAVSVALLGGFLSLHIFERAIGSHEPMESEYASDHKHSHNLAGTVGATAMSGHVFLDGIALGIAFKVSDSLGFAIFAALLVHAFSDGLNTVSLLIKAGNWTKRGLWLLAVDAVMRVSGAAFGTYLSISDPLLAIYLAAFAGMLIYLATSHILPEAHARHSSKLTLLATVFGILIMWIVVANLPHE